MTTLLVASAGGHLVELHNLLPRMHPVDDHRVWVTSDNPQSRALLAGEDVRFVPRTDTRDIKNIVGTVPVAHELLKSYDVSNVISTGSGLAVGVLPYAAARGAKVHYIESATRVGDVSVTGRLLEWVPGIRLYHQYEAMGGRRWRHEGSIYDGFQAVSVEAREIHRIFVTVGTMTRYGFRRLIEKLLSLIPSEVEVVWQTGVTDVSGLALDRERFMPADELNRAIAEADVVVAHCGAGSSVTCLDAGQYAVLVPREKAHDENIDDHHLKLADALGSRGLATTPTVDELTWDHIEQAASHRIEVADDQRPFALA